VSSTTTHEAGRRLCLLFEAGPARYAIEATRVMEVAPPDDGRPSVHGLLPLEDLSVLMGGAPERRPGLAVVLDVSPTRAVRVREGAEVADVGGAPHFQLTRDLAARVGELVRGALLHSGRLYLELRADALGQSCLLPAPPPRIVTWLEAAEGQPMLLFQSGGTVFALPLSQVLHISAVGPAFCPFPVPGGVVAGMLAHGQALWPVYALPGFFGGPLTVEPHVVLAELAEMQVALCASRVLGVESRFTRGSVPGEWRAGSGQCALLPDVTSLLSASNLTARSVRPSDASSPHVQDPARRR
jgi:chemotaxis signal transduction protein